MLIENLAWVYYNHIVGILRIKKMKGNNTMAKKRLDQLDGMRFFMNWLIIISHFEFLDNTVFHQYVLNPSIAVNYFFMLSGFGLYYSMYLKNYQKPEGKAEGIKFALGKIKKLYIPYVICLILCAFYRIATRMGEYGLFKAIGITGVGVVIDLTMLQSLIPNKTIAHGVNAVCWFLSDLFICYIFCPMLCRLIRKIKEKRSAALISIIINTAVIVLVTFAAFTVQDIVTAKTGKELLDALDYSTPYTRIFYVTAGMLIAKLYLLCEDKIEKIPVWAARIYGIILLIVAVIYLWQYPVIWRMIPHTVSRTIDVFLCFAVMAGMLINKGFISSLCRLPAVADMGKDAMYLYFIQFPCIWLSIFIFNFIPLEIPIIQAIVCIIMVFFAGLLLKKISEPLNKAIFKKGKQ